MCSYKNDPLGFKDGQQSEISIIAKTYSPQDSDLNYVEPVSPFYVEPESPPPEEEVPQDEEE